MKKLFNVLTITAALSIALPLAPLASASQGSDDPSDTPEPSASVSPTESPDASASPVPSLLSDDDEEDEAEASETPKVSKTPERTSTPKPSGTVKPSRTPEIEDEDEDEDEVEIESEDEQERVRERLRVRIDVPPALEQIASRSADDDEDIRDIEVDEEEGRVEVHYRLRARLFGLIELPYELEAKVETREGERKVEAKGPWWLFFATDNAGDVQAALEADDSLKEATNQGTILSTIIGILKSLAQ